MPKNWRKVVDDSTQLQYEHDSGGFIVANKQSNGDWRIRSRGGMGGGDIGTYNTKANAKSKMQSYMKRNTEGLDVGIGMDSGMGGGDALGTVDDDLDGLDDLF